MGVCCAIVLLSSISRRHYGEGEPASLLEVVLLFVVRLATAWILVLYDLV